MTFEVIRCYLSITVCVVLTLLAATMLVFKDSFKKFKNILVANEKKAFVFVLIAGAIGYIATILGYFGVTKYVKDFDVFLMWSNIMNDDGLKGFMVEYPAGSLYLFALLRLILRLLGVADNYIITVVFMKLPSIIATLTIGVLVYKWSKKRYNDEKPLLLMIITAFNPVFLINASMWGQIDMILVLVLVLALHYLKRDKRVLSIVLYTLGCLIKAQMIFFAPIFGMFLIMPLFKKETKGKTLKQITIGTVISVVGFTLATLPFKNYITDLWIIDFFKHICNEHPFNTASALNLFGLHGGNAVPDTNVFLFLNYRIWGYIFISLICIICAYLVIKDFENKRVFLLSAFCMASIFTLGVCMHERYIIPVIALLVISYIYDKDKWLVFITTLYTITATINQCMIILDLFGGKTWTFKLFSGINVVIYILFAIYVVQKIIFKREKLVLNE